MTLVTGTNVQALNSNSGEVKKEETFNGKWVIQVHGPAISHMEEGPNRERNETEKDR